jgi:hypothetical protein
MPWGAMLLSACGVPPGADKFRELIGSLDVMYKKQNQWMAENHPPVSTFSNSIVINSVL